MDTNEIKFIIKNTSPFSKLAEGAIDEFIGICEIKEYHTGDIVYRSGAAADYFYLLVEGRMVALSNEAGREYEIELLKRGACFGIISLFTDEPHSVTIKAIEDSVMVRVEPEKFKEFVNNHSGISFDFSQMLSRRVQSRTHPKRIFQCKRIAVMGAEGSGKTTYLFELAQKLKINTNKKVVCVEISPQGKFLLPALCARQFEPVLAEDFNEEKIAQKTVNVNGVDCLTVKAVWGSKFPVLLNYLSESYHFIVYEVPFSGWDSCADDFAGLADYLHVILHKSDIHDAVKFLNEIKKLDPLNAEKIKIILAGFRHSPEDVLEEKNRYSDHPVYATLCDKSSEEFDKAVNRVARYTGEVIVGLALGSGAAFGFTHLGVIKVLEENNITVDMISGTSSGAFIAALWACGFTMDEMKERSRWFGKKMGGFPFASLSLPFQGFFRGRRLENIFYKVFGDRTFHDLKHTLKIVAFDFSMRRIKVLDEGPLYKAVAASCAMPGVFEPIRFGKEILLDGGVLSPLPVKMLLAAGAHKIIAVNITPSLDELFKSYNRQKSFSILDFIFGSIETMQREFIQQAIAVSDVVIHPNMEGIGWMEFDKLDEFVKRGEAAAQAKLGDIKKVIEEKI